LSITNKINFTLIRHSHTIGAPVRPNEEIERINRSYRNSKYCIDDLMI